MKDFCPGCSADQMHCYAEPRIKAYTGTNKATEALVAALTVTRTFLDRITYDIASTTDTPAADGPEQQWNGYHEVELEWVTQDDEVLAVGTTLGLQVWTKECAQKNVVTKFTTKDDKDVAVEYEALADASSEKIQAGVVGYVHPESATDDKFPFVAALGTITITPSFCKVLQSSTVVKKADAREGITTTPSLDDTDAAQLLGRTYSFADYLDDGAAVSWGLNKDESGCKDEKCDYTKTSTGMVTYWTYLTALDWNAEPSTRITARHLVEFDVAFTSDTCEGEVGWTQHDAKEATQDFWRHSDITYVMGEAGSKVFWQPGEDKGSW